MASSNNTKVISVAKPHTIKKFELVELYIRDWIQKLMKTPECKGVVYIDCMSNSGIYHDIYGNEVIGSALRVARILCDAAWQYPSKNVELFFNDKSYEKTELLKQNLPQNASNFHCNVTSLDRDYALEIIWNQIKGRSDWSFFLLYDPYDASINWDMLFPFLRNWGEVLINHMVSDPIRAVGMVTKEESKKKYEGTYQQDYEQIVPYGHNRAAYERRVEEIIVLQREGLKRPYYVASFPFFNSCNGFLYDLVHCTSNIEGFKLFKKSAWKCFGNKSSTRNTHGRQNQLQMAFEMNECPSNNENISEKCYFPYDIAVYLHNQHMGMKDVPLDSLWKELELHPVFPSEGYRIEVKKILKEEFGDEILTKPSRISFTNQRY